MVLGPIKNLIRLVRDFVLHFVLKAFSDFLIQIGFVEKCVIVRIDGGICSQMHFYMIGEYMKLQGYSVKYDLTWFETHGYDLMGKDKRNFDLLKAFPKLELRKACKSELFFYKPFSHINNYFDDSNDFEWQKLTAPVYFQGYYKVPTGFYLRHIGIFKIDVTLLDVPNRAMIEEIRERTMPVAVHVRRGDLAGYNIAYGNPVPVKYFKKATEYLASHVMFPFFYFFSDDPKWVEDYLIKEIELKDNYRIVDINDATKGYFDLFLIASCNHQITSKGSLGKYGAFLNNSGNNIVTIYDDRYERSAWEGEHPNIIFLKV